MSKRPTVTHVLVFSRQLNLKKVLISGGSLDHRVDPQILHDGGGEKLVILALDGAGRVSNMILKNKTHSCVFL